MTQTAVHRSPGRFKTSSTGPAIAVAAATCVAMTSTLLVRDFNQGPTWRVTLVIVSVVTIVSSLVIKKVRRILDRNDPSASARCALVFGVLTVLSVVAFWVAVPPIFAAAAVITAQASRRQGASTPSRTVLGTTLAGIGLTAGLALAFVG